MLALLWVLILLGLMLLAVGNIPQDEHSSSDWQVVSYFECHWDLDCFHCQCQKLSGLASGLFNL